MYVRIIALIQARSLYAMHQTQVSPPKSIICLEQRAQAIAGKTLGQLAEELSETVPSDLLRAKGWVGQLLEKALGATAGNRDIPDFPELGIELKTLPINEQGKPQESTYLCHVTLPLEEINFFQSRAWSKLANVLWVPIQTLPHQPIKERLIGTPLFWSPSKTITQILKTDWDELTERMRLGYYENLSAHQGVYLQLRPKAANSQVLIQVTNHMGQAISIVPRGFYLRADLTLHILQSHYA